MITKKIIKQLRSKNN